MADRTEHDWFEIREFDHEIVGIGEPGHFEDVKSYLVLGRDWSLLIDTGMGFANIREVVERFTSGPVILINSHGHLDHIGDNWRFERRWIHELEVDRVRAGVPHERFGNFLDEDSFSLPIPEGLDLETFAIPGCDVERTIRGGETLDLGNRTMRVLHTPGHSPGSVSFHEERTGVLFPGDAIYEGPLFTHHMGGSAVDYRSTLSTLNDLVPELETVYPSHNRYPLEPEFISRVHEGIEEIWDGRDVDETEEDLVYYQFDGYSFTLRANWWEEEP
jgi:glyoxylase-like metal-dependent hydrolase (beta-lactamase superfamily II)